MRVEEESLHFEERNEGEENCGGEEKICEQVSSLVLDGTRAISYLSK
jgi:hypothetical protein